MAPAANSQSVASAALDKADVSARQPARDSYPPASSIPTTSAARLAKSAEGATQGLDASASDTVLYLAYGSNMCAKTFLGVRGIRPLSQVNVAAPSIRLTFDLPGVPYREPCFANVGFRNVPEEKKAHRAESVHQDMEWDGSLIGIVYEVTQKDYRTIMRTEGAGSSYKEIVVPCYPIAPKETFPKGPTPFLARTLYAAYNSNGDDNRRWWQRLLDGRQRPDPNYAQASLRYLNLLRDGGREHDLPASYQKYLASLHSYMTTRWTQKVGQYVFLALWAPLLIFILSMTGFLADETGKLPPWLAKGVAMLFNVMWMSYDVAFKPIFGDGERTEEENSEDEGSLVGNVKA
ncbi:gliotoxin biosynthesis protein GliK [Pochonia chlamydosporia 170]|uniref:gamma-glutamylcyclotransferase n=1 Tax=Pochonia chlamydosporia 170 TaxID=1380566 RepID=A0A179FUI8_METCM|nr:gliotoxin biosynthesis protein GliK [Pochonia chlamydosporia 170]OAQ68743.1 gliotoxin biosynthesis protein GliK [Pochonia chlamydosporia 170]